MNIDPTMPTLTLGLSEWYRRSADNYARDWLPLQTYAAYVDSRTIIIYRVTGERRGLAYQGDIEDGMRKADVMLREWIEGVPQ